MDFYQDAIEFLDKAWSRLAPYHSLLKPLSIDHICYRTTSAAYYEQAKRYFGSLGVELIESMIGGRPIATYKLHLPILFNGFQIELVEVPAPKASKPTQEGLEHFEFVIPYDLNWVRENFKSEKISEKGASKLLNPEIEVSFEDFAIKFHHKSLEEVIAIEKHPTLCDLIDELGLLTQLSEFTPLISGTIPLQIAHEESDLDLLCQSSDLEAFEKLCHKNWGTQKDFRVERIQTNGLETSVINFKASGLPIEIFCQNKCVFEQNANRHYYAESKLIKLLGNQFKMDLAELKKRGVKTEPAIGELLKIKSPYEELLNLALESEEQLVAKFAPYSS